MRILIIYANSHNICKFSCKLSLFMQILIIYATAEIPMLKNISVVKNETEQKLYSQYRFEHTSFIVGVSMMLYPFPKQALVFTCLQSFEITAGKGEFVRHEQFLLFPQCFLPIWRTLSFSSNLKLSSAKSFSFFWKRLKFVVWERVK